MSDRRTKSEIIAELAKDYAERIRRGERPTAREYSARYPEFSDEVERFIASKRVDETPPSADGGSSTRTPQTHRTAENVQPERIGDFRIIRQVGRGGMGIVYEAEQVSLGRHVALKLLPPQMLLDARQRRRFEREARSAAKLHHTNIVPVFGVGESDGLHYYAMQFIEGLGLDEVLKQVRRKREQCAVSSGITLAPLHVSRRNLTSSEMAQSSQFSSREPCPGAPSASDSDSSRDDDATLVTPLGKTAGCQSASAGSTSAGRLSDSFSLSDSIVDLPTESGSGSVPVNRTQNFWHSVADVGLQVASALQYAHEQGVFHRDIKPSNLLLDTRGTIWVLDFGLAKASDQHDLTHTGDVVGTLRYMPPEAFEGRADARSDIYSLGLTLYEMLALRPAFSEAVRNKLIKQVTSGEPTRLDRLDRKIPRDLVTIVHKAIDRDPKRRYQTAEELADDLNRFTTDKPIQARRTSTIEYVYRWARRNRALSTSIGLIALLLITINIAGPILTIRLKHAYDAEVTARRSAKYAYESEVAAHSRASQAEREAVAALALAKQKEQESLQSLQLAEDREHALNQTLYRAEMSLAGQAAVERTGIERVWDMTAAWRPGLGEEDLRDWEWYYLHGLGRLDQQTIPIDSGNAEAVAWHPSGSQIALGRDDGTVEVLDLRLGRVVFSQNRHHAPVLHVCWNSDGSLLASIASQDDHVRIWEPETERELQTLPLPGDNNWTGSVSFNRNDRLLAADGLDEIAIWDLQTGKRLRTLKMPQGIGHVAWSPTDDRIAAASKQERITIWNGLTGEQLRSLPEGSRCLAWDPQGQRLAFGGQDRRIHVLDAETGEKSSSSVGHVAEITTLAWDASGMRLASAGRDTTVRIWDLPNCDEIARFRGHADTVTSLDWNPSGTLLVTAAQDQTIKIWDADRTDEQITLQGSAGPVQSTSWGPQGSCLAVSSGAWTHLWNIDRRAEESVWQGQLAVINPIDERVAIATQSDIQIRDTRTGKLVQQLLGHTQGITAIRWDSKGKRLASASWDGTVRIWDVAMGKEQTTFRLSHNDRDICWSPDGTCLATIGNREVQIWHVESETMRLEYLDDHQIHAIAWSPDGQYIASSGWGHEITIWDASTAETVMVLTGHTSPVKSLCWSPEGTRLASGSEDQLVRIWDVQSRGELLSLRGHTDGVTSVCWSSDGMRIASGDRQGRVLIWDASSGHLRERTPQSLDILNRRIDSEPSLRDLALRTEVLEKMGRGEAASEDRRRIRLIREADFEEMASDPVALELLVSELSAEVRTREAARWTRIRPIEMTADNGATLSLQPDNSIYVTGPNTSGVQYELSFKASAPVTALRLEAIPDPRLPHGGSGRSAKNGNFHVAEINVFAAQSADAETFDEITIEKCSDDMPESPASRRAMQTIDGNRRTLWDPYPNHKHHHWAVYELAEPLAAEGEDVVIRVRLDSGISEWGPHGLGRFRLSATGTASVLEREELLQFLDGTRSMGIARLGGFYAMLSETQKAETAFATALRSAEDHAARQAIVALASRFDGVVEELFKLLPEDPWVMLARADSLIAGPDAGRAARMRSSAIALLIEEAGNAPETILHALSEAADMYQAREQWDASLQLLRQAYERSHDLLSQEHPRTIELLDKLAATHNRMGNHDRARILREEEVALRQRLQGMEDAQTRASCRSLADLYARSGQISEAISLRVRMAEAAPLEDINASQQAAFFLVWKGDLDEHADLCRKLLASAGAMETVKAARDFAKAVAIGPVTDSDLVEQAVTLAAQAVEADPSNMWGVLSLGMSHYRQGDLMQADQRLTRAADAEPPRLRLLARAFLAMIRFQQGEMEEATNHLHAVEEGLGFVAFTDLRSPFAIHHDDLAIWLALHEVRRMMQVEPVDLQQAVDRLLKWQRNVVERSPEDTRKSLHLAAMYAWFGRDRQHRELCQQLLAAASVSKQAADLERAAKAYLVHAAPEPELLASAAVSAEMAVDVWKKKNSGLLPWAQLTAGMAAYRQQRYTEAIESLTSAQQASNRLVQGPSLLFRSMAFLRQGQRERAEQDFARADELIGSRPDRTSLTEALSQHDDLVFWLAYDEARQQLAETRDEQSSTAD